MSFIIAAPYPALFTFTVLRDPEFSDTDSKPLTMNIRRSMNGMKRTYVKSNDRRQMSWQFKLTRQKAAELRAFLQSYYRAKLQVTDHKDRVWLGYLTNDPFEFSAEARAGGWPGGEELTITVEFQGEQVS